MARLIIEEPIAQPNGSIIGNHKTLYLHGVKPFDSKKVCARASGERWACGLQAYATLRNTVAKKTIACDPKTLLPNAVTATCHIGATNVALVLVRDGLVELDDNADDADLANAQAFAKNRKLGIWDR
jgi:endonuclease YncB( thermonuclease family)